MNRRLYRSRKDQMISGVCAGIGNYLNIDPTIVRIVFLVALFSWGTGVLIYIVCSLVIPIAPLDQESYDYTVNEENRHSSPTPFVGSSNARIVFGIILVIIGAISILEKIFGWFDFDLIWPIALIGVGFLILTKDKKN